jgi:hypothetical protein
MSMAPPPPAGVQMILDKGKPKEYSLRVRMVPQSGFVLDVQETKGTFRTTETHALRRVISELKAHDGEPCSLVLVTPSTEVTFVFRTPADAQQYHDFISEKSEVHAENRAIAQLDEDMRRLWPFPGGSFF